MRKIFFAFAIANAMAVAAAGQGFAITASFPEGTGPSPDFTHLVIEFEQVRMALTASNTCPRIERDAAGDRQLPCSSMYRFENRGTSFVTIGIDSVTATASPATGFPELKVKLHEAPKTLKSLFFVALNLQSTSPTGTPPMKGYLEVPIGPQLAQKDDSGDEPFERFRTTQVVDYRSVTPIEVLPGDMDRLRARLSGGLSITDPMEYDRQYTGEVTDIRKVDHVGFVHELTISGVPRGTKVNVKISGFEKYAGEDLQASTTVQPKALPKTRDDADLWIKIAADADNVKKDRKYSLDTRIHSGWRNGRWDIGPTLDGVIGNVTSKAPNTAALSFDMKYWLPVVAGGELHSQSISLSPIFRTDRSFANRDVGADLVYAPILRRFDQTLDERRKAEKRLGGPPLVRNWGWSVRSSLALEAGRHIASTSPDVRHKEFSRLRVGLSATLEWRKWKLTMGAQSRHLFNDELFLQGTSVVRTSKAERNYARGDLSYDLGTVSLLLTHIAGRQPPAFSVTQSTSLGVAFKF